MAAHYQDVNHCLGEGSIPTTWANSQTDKESITECDGCIECVGDIVEPTSMNNMSQETWKLAFVRRSPTSFRVYENANFEYEIPPGLTIEEWFKCYGPHYGLVRGIDSPFPASVEFPLPLPDIPKLDFKNNHDGVWKCFRCKCGKQFDKEEERDIHFDQEHLGVFICKAEGCNIAFTMRDARKEHLETIHSRFSCEYETCPESYASKQSCNMHQENRPLEFVNN
ncbi:hypothetical protein C8J55DRAFT_490105 [Lentinula edodes]|uniref:C2H2-type domain-containing protein n=1 Tax=Lentinula lateritia TaxID=40482 RepID=A0A9W9A8I9_9AGAR|nr:hypothetical protein C8J55DRAFT_490105 [Lentinula edodes]